MKKPIYVAIIIGLFLTGCKTQKVAYQLTSVPEEGGISFTQLTQEDENIIHPGISVNEVTKALQWWAPPLLAISPDGEKLAYLAKQNNYHNLYIRNISGGRSKIQRTFNRNVYDMTYSPDGKNIAFTDKYDGNNNINLINATEGAAVTQLAGTAANELGPTFTPNGKIIFYTVQQGIRYYVWSVNVETGLKTQHCEGYTPVLTPDGKKLLVTRNNKDTGLGEIWVIDLDKGQETFIFGDKERGFSSPSISSDGETIAMVGVTKSTETRARNLDIYTVKIDGTKFTQLTFHEGHDVSPIWDNTGENIIFLAQRGNSTGAWNIWKMNIKK